MAKQKEMLLAGSKTKEVLKCSGKETYVVSADALEGVNKYVHCLVEQAQLRPKANGRKKLELTIF